MKKIPVYNILLTEYGSKSRLPYVVATNKIIDRAIKQHFIGRHVCIRVLSSSVHSGRSIDEVVHRILQTGTDRYNPRIKSGQYYRVGKPIDFFALDFLVTPRRKILDEFTWRRKLKPPLKIDIVIIYNVALVQKVSYTPPGRIETKHDGYTFKNPLEKYNAVVAIFKIKQ